MAGLPLGERMQQGTCRRRALRFSRERGAHERRSAQQLAARLNERPGDRRPLYEVKVNGDTSRWHANCSRDARRLTPAKTKNTIGILLYSRRHGALDARRGATAARRPRTRRRATCSFTAHGWARGAACSTSSTACAHRAGPSRRSSLPAHGGDRDAVAAGNARRVHHEGTRSRRRGARSRDPRRTQLGRHGHHRRRRGRRREAGNESSTSAPFYRKTARASMTSRRQDASLAPRPRARRRSAERPRQDPERQARGHLHRRRHPRRGSRGCRLELPRRTARFIRDPHPHDSDGLGRRHEGLHLHEGRSRRLADAPAADDGRRDDVEHGDPRYEPRAFPVATRPRRVGARFDVTLDQRRYAMETKKKSKT